LTIDNAQLKLDRHQRFWQPLKKGEGSYLYVSSPITDDPAHARPPLRDPAGPEERWLGVDYCVEAAETKTARTFYGLDAIQHEFVNIGPGSLAAMIGGNYQLQPNTVWYDLNPIIKDWGDVPALKLNKQHELYRVVAEKTAALTAASQGRWLTSFTDIGGSIDILWSLRGEELLTDMIDYPEEILMADGAINDAFIEMFESQLPVLSAQKYYTCWFPLVHTQPWYPMQCDMCVMFSPAMFERFVMPGLTRISQYLGQSVYHLDGTGEIKHLDMLLSIPQLHAIQWTPEPKISFISEESLGVYKKTLAAGRKVVLLGVPPEQLQIIFDAVGRDGLFILTHPGTRKEADDLIAYAQKEWVRL